MFKLILFVMFIVLFVTVMEAETFIFPKISYFLRNRFQTIPNNYNLVTGKGNFQGGGSQFV